MGCYLSRPEGSQTSAAVSESTAGSSHSMAIDLRSYETACRADLDLQSFDSVLQERTSSAILSIAVDLDKRSVSLESLGRSMECLRDMNEDGVRFILQNKKEIWKTKELSDFVDDYFENSLETLNFCTALDACLTGAGRIESILNVALRKFHEEHYCAAAEPGAARDYSKTLEELRNFQSVGDPFTQEFFRVYDSARSRQLLMWDRLQAKKRKLDRKLGKLKAWRRVSNVVFAVTFASVLIFSVVAAAVSAPPVVAAVAAAAAVPLAPTGKWMNSFWKKCEKVVRGQREIVSTFEFGSFFVIQELNSIGACVRRFEVEMEALTGNADFAMRGEEAVAIAAEEIRKQVDGFFKTIRELRAHADKCSQSTKQARAVTLRKMMTHPNQD